MKFNYRHLAAGIVLSVFLTALMSACGSSPTAIGSPLVKKFEKAMANNDFAEMEKILQKSAKKMNLTECMADALNPEWVPGFKAENTVPVMRLLVRYGADVNGKIALNLERGGSNRYPLLVLAFGNEEAVNFMLENKVNLDATCEDTQFSSIWISLLVYCLRYGPDANALFLIEHNANVNKGTSEGVTPLMRAALNNDIQFVKLLVEKGADVNLRVKETSLIGKTALQFAQEKGYVEIADYLTEHGAREFEPIQATSSGSSSSGSSSSGSAPSTGGSAQATLRDGTYQMSGSTNSLQFNTTLKSVEMTVGGKAIARGSYQINGSTLSVTFTLFYGDAADREVARKQFDGKTFVYTLAGDSSFSGNGETWTRTGF